MRRQRAVPGPEEGTRPSVSGTPLRVLFDVGHPAHVHLFKNPLRELEKRGHQTFVTARKKEVTLELLEAYDIDYKSLSTRGETLPKLVAEVLIREVRLLSVARQFRPDVIVGRLGPVPAHISTVLGSRYVAVSDTHIDNSLLRRLHQGITFPFVDTICVPESFQLPIDDRKRQSLDFQELAYLHPRYFEPDPDLLAPYDIDLTEPFSIIRLAGWDAYHDVGYSGLSPDGARELVSILSEHGQVFISAEKDLPTDLAEHRLRIRPEHIHHVLALASLYVGDSGTMSTEAAMLGTPAVRTNTMVGPADENVFHELEETYGLLQSFADESAAIDAVQSLLSDGLENTAWDRRRDQLLADHPDVTERIVRTILESLPTIDH